MPIEHRRTLIKSMGLAVLTLHCGTWWSLTEGEFRAWQGAWFQLVGWLYPRQEDGSVIHKSFAERAQDLKSPMPMELLMLYRLRLLVQTVRESDVFLIQAILHNHRIAKEESWLHSVLAALKWMREQTGAQKIVNVAMGLDQPNNWLILQQQCQQLPRQVKKAEKAHILRVRMYCDLVQSNAEQITLLKEMGWMHDDDIGSNIDDQGETFVCKTCDKGFSSEAALAVHRQRKHGERIAIRRVLADDRCRVCRKRFFTRARTIIHLHSGQTQCWVKVLRNTVPMTVERAAELDANDRAQGNAIHQRGFKTLQDDSTCRPCTEREMDDILEVRFPWHDVPDGPPEDNELHERESLGMLPIGYADRHKTSRKPSEFAIANVLHEVQAMERTICADVVHWRPDYDRVPPPLVQDQKYVLLFFSGRRRMFDIAYYIQEASNLIPISIDTSVDELHGDMYKTDLWLQLIKQRKVAEGHGGPLAKFTQWQDGISKSLKEDLDHCGRTISHGGYQSCPIGNCSRCSMGVH